MESSGTMLMLGRMHGDRWSSWGEDGGIQSISNLLRPDQLRRFWVFEDFDDTFLKEIGPDVSLAEWKAGAIVFEAGTYLDLAFLVVDGEVEVSLGVDANRAEPIFTTQLAPTGAPLEATGAAGATASRRRPRAQGETITFLATMDFDLARGERLRLGPDEIFGEIGALNGWPESATARTTRPTTLLQIRIPALRKLRRKSKRLKARLDEVYRDRMLRQHLSLTPLLRECPAPVIDVLARQVELVSAQPDEVLVREGEPAEHLILVRSGFVKMSQALEVADVVVTYVGKGATVGELELLMEGLDSWQVTATSIGHSELVRIGRAELIEILDRDPQLRARLRSAAMQRIKEIGFTRSHLDRSELLEFALDKGTVQASSLLVIDLETCTRCDDCVRGCAETHGGIPRFVREGEVYDGFLIPRSCYHCQDPVCLVGCPTGAIRRANVGSVIEIDPGLCIGCSACEQNCPYDAIVMHDLGTTWGARAVPRYLRGQPRQMASKCDLCYTSRQGPACVSSCPHGSSARVSSLEEFDLLRRAKRRQGAPA
jgi:CRP-like cAMP-binding protein/Fe-S-cluster-containing dehydrogenase component